MKDVLKDHVISCRLTKEEAGVLKEICTRHALTMQEMLRAIVVDAIYDEMLNVRRREQEGRSSARETS
jgi:hypothetical protein